MQVSIALLPVSLSLLHIPRSRLPALSTPVLRQLLHPSPGFFNITCNEIELSIFAEHHMLSDFEAIARKDRHKQHSRSGSGSSRNGNPQGPPSYEPVEISYEGWSVLQIDSHSDQIDNSGTRVHDLSAPLAAAGISILYQSSYMSDFIFVKESRLQEAMELFESSGFHLYVADADPNSPPATSSPTTDEASFLDLPSLSSPQSRPICNGGAVLIHNTSAADLANSLSSLRTSASDSPDVSQSPRTKAHSPTSGEVRILHPDLACVGLSEEFGVDHWGLKIIKLVAFPDLISTPHTPSNCYSSPRRHQQNTLPFHPAAKLRPSISELSPSSSCSSPTSTSEDDDGYFSHSPQSASADSFTSTGPISTTKYSSCSYSDLQSLAHPGHKSPSKHVVSGVPPLKPLSPIVTPTRSSISTQNQSIHDIKTEIGQGTTQDGKTSLTTHGKDTEVPFFSFTRTPEGSSLTADVNLLARLFPPHERHMVICSGELDAADLKMESMGEKDCGIEDWRNGEDSVSIREEEDQDEYEEPGHRSLKCLQIDLRRFGLDKHGLVNRFSRVLEENGINHMYSSTFKTANLLVDKRHALRAQSLLRAC